MARNEMGELAVQIQIRLSGSMVETQQVNGFGDKGHFGFIGEIHTPNQVVDGLVTIVDLVGDRTLPKVQQGSPDSEVRRKDIIQTHSEHPLVHLVVVVRFRRDGDGRSGSQDALVGNSHHTHVIVDRIVHIFRQSNTAGGHFDRFRSSSAGEMEFRTVRRTIASLNVVFVLVGNLLRHRFRHRIKRIEGIFVCQSRVIEHGAQIFTERLRGGEIDSSVVGVDGTAIGGSSVNEVEDTVRSGILLLVQSVQTHQPDQRDTLLGTLREETVGRAFRVTRIENVQAELVSGKLISGKTVNILHHEFPQRRLGVQAGTLQQLDTDTVRGGHLIGELTHLINMVVTDDRILEGHCQHLVSCQSRIQRDETQFGVHRVFTGRKQTGTLHFFVVGS